MSLPPGGDVPGSCSTSEVGLQSVHVCSQRPHPEQWTLTKEWNIEKRETYNTWKLDVQHQIAYMDRQLYSLMNRHPEPGTSYHNVCARPPRPHLQEDPTPHTGYPTPLTGYPQGVSADPRGMWGRPGGKT